MSSIRFLFAGELKRNSKYGITAASLFATFFWILVLHFASADGISRLFPLLLFADATLMSLLLAGVTLIFESQENVLKSLLVTPIDLSEYLVAKGLAVVSSAVTTFILLLVYGMIFKSVSINILGMLLAVMLAAFAFGQLGLILTFFSKDFTDLLVNMMKFTFLFAIPTILEFTGLISANWLTALQYLNPTKHALVVMQAAALPVPRQDLVIAIVYLIAFSVFGFVTSRRLIEDYAVKGGGA